MVALKIGGPVESIETRKVVAVANVCGVKLNHIHTKDGDEAKKGFLLFSPFGLYPVLDIPSGPIIGSTAVAAYLASQNMGANLISGESHQLAACISAMETCKAAMEQDTEAYLAFLEVHFTSKSYLVGERLSVADIVAAVHVKSVEDSNTIPVAVGRWLRTIMSDNRAAKALKTQAASQSPKKTVGKKDIKKADEKIPELPVVPTKLETPISELPATTFNMESFKRFYSNCKDLEGEGMTHLFENIDREGYAVWKVKYDKMEGECDKDYLTSNLLGGFMQAMPVEARKFGMGVFDVMKYGEGDYNYEGVLILRGNGKDMPAFMFDHRSFEYHFWTALNLDCEEDKKYISDVLCNDAGDKLCGFEIVDAKQFK